MAASLIPCYYKNILLVLLGFLIFLKTSQCAAIGNGGSCNSNCSTEVNSSVCSNTGVTYPSRCKFEEAKCNAAADWTIIYEHACPDACTKNCSNEKVSKVCSSNVQTFNSRCEFEKQRCLQNEQWEIIFENECATLAPPTSHGCRDHLNRRRNEPADEIRPRCFSTAFWEKYNNLTFSDIEHCYYPSCTLDGAHYLLYQCDHLHRNWCWCAKPDGTVIPGTFGESVTRKDCEQRTKCSYDGELYDDGEDFFPKGTCGKCTCLNGTPKCALYNSSVLDDGQLETLKNDLLQLFFYQRNNYQQSGLTTTLDIDVLHTSEHPYYISDQDARDILRFKFRQYDKDNSLTITSQERHVIDIEVFSFLHCINFRSQVFSLMDSNHDYLISLKEWGEFFGVENLTRRRRSASNRRKQRKVQYVLA